MVNKVVFVDNKCTRRAPTFRNMVELDFTHDIFCRAKGLYAYHDYDQLTADDLDWCDLIVCMTIKEAMRVLEIDMMTRGKIVILGVGPDYEYMDADILAAYNVFHKPIFKNIADNSKASESWRMQG